MNNANFAAQEPEALQGCGHHESVATDRMVTYS